MIKKLFLAIALSSISSFSYAVADSNSTSTISVRNPKYVIVDAGAVIKLDTETGESWVLITGGSFDEIKWAKLKDDGSLPEVRDLVVVPKQVNQQRPNSLRY